MVNDVSMSHPLDDLIEAVLSAIPVDPVFTGETALDFIRSLREDGYEIVPRWATGGLSPELVAKALWRAKWELTADPAVPSLRFNDDEVDALRAATFEVSTLTGRKRCPNAGRYNDCHGTGRYWYDEDTPGAGQMPAGWRPCGYCPATFEVPT